MFIIMTNYTTANNLIISGNQTISGNILSSGTLQTTTITSSSINNINSITTNSINGTTANLTNASVSNILSVLSNTPINFIYNSNQYSISALTLFNLFQLSGASIASQSYVQTQISNLINSSPNLLNTLDELANAINDDPNFSVTMTNLIATKVSLASNNTISGSNTFSSSNTFSGSNTFSSSNTFTGSNTFSSSNTFTGSNTFSSSNTFTGSNTFSSSNTFTGSNTFNSSSGNIIDRLFSTVLSINNGNTRRNVANCFEVGMGQTSPYIYYDNAGKFGSVNTNNSSLSWNISLDGILTIPTISSTTGTISTLNSTTGTITNLYSNILAVNNNNTRRAANDIFEVATSSTGNYLYYNNSSTFGHINTSDSNMSWFINSSGSATIPTINSTTGTITTLNSTTGNITTLNSTTATITTLNSTNLYSNILAINNNNVRRATNDIFEVAVTPTTGNYIYYNNSSVFGHINTSNSALSWYINSSGLASLPSLAINSPSVRGSGDLLTVSVTPTGNYLYLNNGCALGVYNTTGSPSNFPWLIDSNGDARFRSINLTNGYIQSNNLLNVNPNTITNNTFTKTLGLTNILVTTIELQPYYSDTFTINTPISLYRQYRNVTANGSLFNRIYDTLNSVTYTILKNGSTFATGTCTTNNSLPNAEIYVSFDSITSSSNYEIYITNASCTFTPSVSSTVDIYTVNYTVNYSQNMSWQNFNLIIESFGYNTNTNISGFSGNQNQTIQTGGPGSNYSSYNYLLSSNFSTNTSKLQINKIVSNSIHNQNTITTNNLSVTTLKSNNLLYSQQLTSAYMLDGTKQIGFNWHPITCSQFHLKSPDLDDNYVVYPGYKLNLYYNDGYNAYAGTIDNYTGTTIRYASSASIYGSQNQINSCRLYYLNDSNEITNDIIS